jgi:cephalosporin-C deacetylase
MAFFDMPLEELRVYRPERDEQPDFDAYWADTLADARARRAPTTFAPAHPELRALEVFDATFTGFGGQPIRAWFILPRHRERPLPVVVEYIGYGGGRGFPIHWLTWPAAGYATFVMDTRGQGSSWRPGDTPDPDAGTSGPQYSGFLTRGIDDPVSYFYRRVFTDAAMAVSAVRDHEAVDGDRVVVAGASQGGGIALAAAALEPAVVAALVDVPFLCHYRRAIEITDEHPYAELRSYLATHRTKADAAFRTLSYADGVNLATRAKAPVLMSVGLMDQVCPPSTVFAAYNHYAGPKEIRVWPYNAHEAGQNHHVLEQLRFLQGLGIVP